MSEEIQDKKDIEVYLTEYRALRDEQKTRLTINSTILNVLIVILAGALAAYVKLHGEESFASIMLVAPIITAPLVLLYYDNQLMVYRIGRYFSSILYPRIRLLTYNDAFEWETFHQSTSGQLWLVALGRNFLLVLMPLGPLLIFLISNYDSLQNITRWEKCLILFDLVLLIAVIASWIHSGRAFNKTSSA